MSGVAIHPKAAEQENNTNGWVTHRMARAFAPSMALQSWSKQGVPEARAAGWQKPAGSRGESR